MNIAKSESSAAQVPWDQFFNHAPIAMGVLSREGEDARFQQANAASAAQLGISPSEMAGRSALELRIPPALVQGWLMSLEAARQLQAPLDVRWQLSTQHGLRTFTTRVLAFGDEGADGPEKSIEFGRPACREVHAEHARVVVAEDQALPGFIAHT